MSRIGVFVCHCGINIADTVDVERVAEIAAQDPSVRFATTYKYMCSDPGQQLVRDAIVEHGLDGVVVAACSPTMHEKTFRQAVTVAGLNPYRCEIANIREQCSWVHQKEPEQATEKAIEIVRTLVEKVRRDEELTPSYLSITRRALVIGGGVAGLEAALGIASAGYPVVLVEREDRLGGKMARLSGTYLNFEAAPDLLQRRIEQVLHHPNIQVLLGAQVVKVEGYVGNFEVLVDSGFAGSNLGTSEQAESTNSGSANPRSFEIGAIVVATGWDPYPLERLPEYGGGEIADVVDSLAFEEMLRPGAELRRPSDGLVPRDVVFVQCAGS
ncbi:MAG TPA: CoB--CoM heterodisulfide reductase iron-sulfur subunit A family protein, partial [Chloroflexi bacterium]|nr:CoB--CoM heterodisulfide reductase iron-sulfur subunit A family protein [Chloroflexota bacterium]